MRHRINKEFKLKFKSNLGDDFRLEKPEELDKKKWCYTEKDLDEVMKKHSLILEMRGRIIGACLTIERRLESYIADVFCTKNKKLLFKELILEKEFCTFMNKWKILRELTHILNIKSISEKERKELLTLIKGMMETRDRFAHGRLIFSGKNPNLCFQSGGKKVSMIIDQNFFQKFEIKFRKTIHLFDKFTKSKYLKGSVY
jgi:hypothetical protein